MRAVHDRFACMSQLRKARIRLNTRSMKHFGLALVAIPIVRDGRTNLAWEVLYQRAAEKCVEGLCAKANPQNRLALSEAVLQERKIRSLAVRVCLSTLRVSGGAISLGIHICRASGEQHSIEGSRQLLEFVGREPKRYWNRLPTGLADRIQ